MLKNGITILIIFFVLIFFEGCKSNKTISKTDKTTQNNQMKGEFISGSVDEIQRGKDGYTAKITTPGKQVYYATISHSNLKNPEQYKTVKIGDTISVKGDIWKQENENHIIVRELQ